MIFGRQNNMRRRAFRPDGREAREIRRRGVGKDRGVTLLDAVKGGARPPSVFERLAGAVARMIGRR